jgi:hypothetical protein
MREEENLAINKPMHSTVSFVGSKSRRRAALLGFLVTVALVLALLAPQLLRQRSAFAVFNEVKLTMSRGQVQNLLRSGGIACRWSGAVSSNEICEFSDFWREYRIAISTQTGQVVRRSFAFKSGRFVRF